MVNYKKNANHLNFSPKFETTQWNKYWMDLKKKQY